MPELEIAISRPQRWDEPFGDLSEREIDQLLQVEPLRSIDASEFPPSLPLRGILRGDARINHYEPGQIVVREGDYGHSAFLVLSGTVRVVLDRLNPELLGRDVPRRRTWLQAIAQLWQNEQLPEVRRNVRRTMQPDDLSPSQAGKPAQWVFVQDIPRLLDSTGTVRLGVGEMFGELAALARTPRTATVVADATCTLLEIRWQGLRDIMRRTTAIREHVARLYRENSLRVHLRETPLLRDLSDDALARVAAASVFESYGNFDWYTDFGPQRRRDSTAQLAAEPLIAEEGEPVTGLLLIRSGFARVSSRRGHGHQTLSYIGKGKVFGWEDIAAAQKSGATAIWQRSLRAVGYVDVLRIPTDVVKSEILTPRRLPINESINQSEIRNQQSDIDSRLLDFLSDHRFLNGTQTMLINLDRCTRCDDCVRACAATHDNNPRFVRQGPAHEHIMVAEACMHCVDPVCMIGCPTGAIGREMIDGTVHINDRTCIGCGTCANSCPYDAIRMVEIREPGGAIVLDSATHQPILKATKCDFCADQLIGPACQNACPHDALVRIDMSDASPLAQWLGQ